MERQRTQNSQLSIEEQSRRTDTTGPQHLPKATVIQIIWHRQHNKDQQSRNRAQKQIHINMAN